MAKKNTSNKEFKPVIEDKKALTKDFPTDKMVKIIFNGKEYIKGNECAKGLVESGKAKLS